MVRESDSDLEPTVKVDRRLLERLRALSGSSSGCLYGLPVSADRSEPYFVWTATGKEDEDGQPQKGLEVLTEILPCGIDPVGVFSIGDSVDHDMIQKLVEQLPESFLDVSDPVVFIREGSGDVQVFVFTEGELLAAQLEKVDAAEEVKRNLQVIRVRGDLSVVSMQTEVDLQMAFKHLIEKVSCPYGTFRLENSDVFFLHVWESRKKSTSMGWAASQESFQEDEEQCLVTNIDDRAKKIADLWRFVRGEEDEDDGFGPVKEKKKVEEKETLNFKLLMKMAGEACSSKTMNCAPIIHFEKREVKAVRIPIRIDALGVVRKSTNIPDVMEVLKGCVQRQIHEMGRSVMSELKMRGTSSLPEVFHFKPEPLGHLCSIVYNKRGTCLSFAEFRKHIHLLFFLPREVPLFRRMNRYRFQDDLPKRGPLNNVHVGLKMGSTGGEVHLVQGTYTYHHYMQDSFNDDGWGCAYRSLQTLISWFRHQGYTETEVPTHAEIQKCLVDIGDKESSFIDSRQWIGSTEVGFVLEKACDVQSKFLSVSSGEDLQSKGRDLANHFNSNGTPVMIGGGVLAHTILGVDWNESTGDIRFLILDPHFTGADWTNTGKPNVALMQQKGWVGWKGPDFWVKGAFYNMCMPQRPKQW